MQNWYLIYSTRNSTEASIIKGMLEENNFPVFIINKQDSSYLNFGDIEIWVHKHFKDIAKNLIDKSLFN